MSRSYFAVLLTSTTMGIASPSLAQQAASSQTGQAGEILVTAQRRAQSAQDVPISISQFSQESLERLQLNDTTDLAVATPGLNFQEESSASQVSLRGVGTGYSGPGLEGSVAIYIDGSYISSQVAAVENFLDIRQIQVLKGPQGALYGRNATGGAVLIDTNDPSTDQIEGHVSAGYGNLDWLRSEAVLNLPVTNTLAVRFAGAYQNRDGHVYNVFTGNDISGFEAYTLRGKILFEPTDTLRIVGKLEYSERDYGNNPRKQIASGELCLYCNTADQTLPSDFYHVNQNEGDQLLASLGARRDLIRDDGNLRNNTLSGNITISYDIGDITLQSTTG